MTKNQILIEHIVVTFIQAAMAYLSINQTNLHGDWKIVAIGAVGAGLSAIYNVLRQSTPTISQHETVQGTIAYTTTPDPTSAAWQPIPPTPETLPTTDTHQSNP